VVCTLDNGGDGEGAAQSGGVLLAGDTGERLALRVLVVSCCRVLRVRCLLGRMVLPRPS
jgi:hypothetical protein